jgi:hypothetical protein
MRGSPAGTRRCPRELPAGCASLRAVSFWDALAEWLDVNCGNAHSLVRLHMRQIDGSGVGKRGLSATGCGFDA